MSIAVLYDIHANLPALQAVLAEVRRLGTDQIIVGGDVLPGPMPRDTLACLLNLDIPTLFIYGNGEVAVLEEIAGRKSIVPERHRPTIQWTANQLEPHQKLLLSAWPQTIRAKISDLGDALFCHATPRNENECFTRLTPEERLLPIFVGLDVPLVVCGHTHMQFDRVIGAVRVVNAGSVGMPFGEPGADWLLLGPTVEFRHTQYDLATAAEQIRATSYPQAEEFAVNNVLQPPTEAKMLELFARA